MAKIFIRERRRASEEVGHPRFAVVGVQGSDLKFFKTRVRREEVDAIAAAIDAEVIVLPRSDDAPNSGEGGKRRRRRRREG